VANLSSADSRNSRDSRPHWTPDPELEDCASSNGSGSQASENTASVRDPCTCRDRTARPALEHESNCPIRLTFLPEPAADFDADSD